MAERSSAALRTGPGRLLTFFYGLLAVAATGRSAYQLAAMFSRAPTAYLLSAVAAVIYIAAFAAIVTDRRRVAFVACTIELAGVIVVGTLSYMVRHDFPDSTVWSGYGSGYGYLPAVLPILALIWLARAPRSTAPAP
jgi:cytochrome bd-type quinol oxidase subunit 2